LSIYFIHQKSSSIKIIQQITQKPNNLKIIIQPKSTKLNHTTQHNHTYLTQLIQLNYPYLTTTNHTHHQSSKYLPLPFPIVPDLYPPLNHGWGREVGNVFGCFIPKNYWKWESYRGQKVQNQNTFVHVLFRFCSMTYGLICRCENSGVWLAGLMERITGSKPSILLNWAKSC